VTTVLVTRAPRPADELVARLEMLGYDVAVCPLIEIEPLGDETIDVSDYDWFVVTSVNGASELRRRMHGAPARVAAIGRATAEAYGGKVDLVPRTATQEGLIAEFPRPAGRVLFAGAEGARRLIVEKLGADFVPLYRTREVRPDELPPADVAVVASPSAARALAAVDRAYPAVSIGPETTRAARNAGLVVLAEAETHDASGVVDAVRAAVPLAP
jgi:uroporphyrinogen-III synthase